MAVTALGLMLILLIALPALLCIRAIRDLVKLAKRRKRRPTRLQESRPDFLPNQPILGLILLELINED
jgi:hypothetical protein